MKEAQKTSLLRGPDFVSIYLSGKVIDIGAGKDLVCPWAEAFDLQHGDANTISVHRPQAHYDAVHSSHCLEHMLNPPAALLDWWSLLKPGGYLVLVVPEEDLYEQGIWPSKFNRDHKATFRLGRATTWSPVSFDIRELVLALPDCELISADLQDAGFDHSLRLRPGQKPAKMPRRLKWLRSIGGRLPVIGPRVRIAVENYAVRHGVPVDQTARDALAQIQVVARKRLAPDSLLSAQCPAMNTAAPLVQSSTITAFHARCTANRSWAKTGEREFAEGVWSYIELNHRFNNLLWDEEDLARRTDVADGDIAINKRAIDRYNQSRNNAIENIDECILSSLAGVPRRDDARLNSETAGSMIDRLSILSLKVFHMGLQLQRTDVGAAHIETCAQKQARLKEQRDDLAACFDGLLAECRSGSGYYKIYRQFKMYNDPTLNPMLYGAPAKR